MTGVQSCQPDTSYPSANAMKAAVEMEIMKAIGGIQTVGIGQLIQKVVDAEAATLQARVEELTKALKATREQLIKVRDASPEIRNHELETNQVIAQAWHTLNDTGVAIPLEDR